MTPPKGCSGDWYIAGDAAAGSASDADRADSGSTSIGARLSGDAMMVATGECEAAVGSGGPAVAGAALDGEFRCMLARLAVWKDLYYDCIVPRKVRSEVTDSLPGEEATAAAAAARFRRHWCCQGCSLHHLPAGWPP